MKRFVIRFLKNEDGQSLILFALLLTVLLGIAALVIDLSMVQLTKAQMQDAADAAALAGALDLPKANIAESTAKNYAELNGADKSNTTVKTPYKGDPTRIEVVCTKNVQYAFARVFGFKDEVVSARAVAKKNPEWTGEALPFINLDDNYEIDPKIVAWEKTGPGDYESMWKDEYQIYNADIKDKTYFTIDYSDGIEVTKGTVATIKQEVGNVYEQNKPTYIFSLSSDVIRTGKYNNLINKDVIPLADLVLLQVTFDSYDYSGKSLFLTVTGVYGIIDGVFPVDYLNAQTSVTSSLVE